jgi:SAM-dependent methyltransferase
MERNNAQDAKAIEEPGGPSAGFDAFAETYDSELNRGLRLSGESKEYFAESRMLRLRVRLAELDFAPGTALDFGCGTGSATPFFFGVLGIQRLLGIDPSEASLVQARRQWGEFPATFSVSTAGREGSCDLAFCNGVFHHIPVAERDAAFATVRGILKPGGVFAFWENNPWNPVTRLAMRQVPFDADAILVWPHEARRRLRENGFEVLRTDYAFFFPKCLSAFRFLEPWLRWLPLGGQYLVLCRKAP